MRGRKVVAVGGSKGTEQAGAAGGQHKQPHSPWWWVSLCWRPQEASPYYSFNFAEYSWQLFLANIFYISLDSPCQVLEKKNFLVVLDSDYIYKLTKK